MVLELELIIFRLKAQTMNFFKKFDAIPMVPMVYYTNNAILIANYEIMNNTIQAKIRFFFKYENRQGGSTILNSNCYF